MAEAVAEAGATPAGGKARRIALIAVAVLLLLALAGGGAMMLLARGQAADEAEAEAPASAAPAAAVEPHYLSLAPPFVVNFQSASARARFLKVELDVMTHDAAHLPEVEKHMPAVRNAVVLLLSRQTYDELMAHEGKERLRAEVLAEIRRVLEAQAGAPIVEDVYFTSFVMQ